MRFDDLAERRANREAVKLTWIHHLLSLFSRDWPEFMFGAVVSVAHRESGAGGADGVATFVDDRFGFRIPFKPGEDFAGGGIKPDGGGGSRGSDEGLVHYEKEDSTRR